MENEMLIVMIMWGIICAGLLITGYKAEDRTVFIAGMVCSLRELFSVYALIA